MSEESLQLSAILLFCFHKLGAHRMISSATSLINLGWVNLLLLLIGQNRSTIL